MSQQLISSIDRSTTSPALTQFQTGVVAPTPPPNGPDSTSSTPASAGPPTFNALAAPPVATKGSDTANGPGGPGGTGEPDAPGPAPSGTVADAQQPGAGKTTQSGSNDAVSNGVSASLTAVGGSTDADAGSSSTTTPNGSTPNGVASTSPLTGSSLTTANDANGHLNAYLSVYA
jgi:hypothetical protein